jgi:hypothetical protein
VVVLEKEKRVVLPSVKGHASAVLDTRELVRAVLAPE